MVVDRGGSDLDIRVGEGCARLLEHGAQPPKLSSHRDIERKDGDGGQDPFLDVAKMSLGIG